MAGDASRSGRGGESSPDLNPDPESSVAPDGRIEPFKGAFENQAVQARLGQRFDRPVRQIDLGRRPYTPSAFRRSLRKRYPKVSLPPPFPFTVLWLMVRFERSQPRREPEGDFPVCLDGEGTRRRGPVGLPADNRSSDPSGGAGRSARRRGGRPSWSWPAGSRFRGRRRSDT